MSASPIRFALHGGAGVIDRASLDAEREADCHRQLRNIAEQARLMVANIEHQIENLVQEIAELEHKIARLISGVEHAVVHAGGTVIHSASHGFGLW